MCRFVLWARCFILILFCVDYNLAEDRDEEVQRLTDLVKGWPEKQRWVCLGVRLREIASVTQSLSINIVEKIKGGRRNNENHYRFDFMIGGTQLRSFYDFQIDAFVQYYEKNLQFILREGGQTETLSLDFVSADEARYFYSRAATFGNVYLGRRVDRSVDSSEVVVESYIRGTSERKSTSENYAAGVVVHSRLHDKARIFNLSTCVFDEANSKVPILIFSSRKFNIGREVMGRKVMLYLTDHADTIFVVSFPASDPEAAIRFYGAIKRDRSTRVDGMLTLTEMQLYDRS